MTPRFFRIPTRRLRQGSLACLLFALLLPTGACDSNQTASSPPGESSRRPSVLLVTLDTTRADAIGPDARGIQTPAFNLLAARGRRFRQAYATVPETLPSHSSMMTGLYAGGHGVHENARFLGTSHPVLAERLQKAGYRTAAFVSAFVLARRFGLARGFDVYDDEQPSGRAERTAKDTTDRAVAYLDRAGPQPLLLWVHYFDPHYPYAPPEPFLRQYATQPYLGEVAAMDEQMGRLVHAFEQRMKAHAAQTAFVIAGDHGEAFGDHGERQHGNLLYQSTMHVPLVVAGPGVAPGVSDTPVSTRRIFDTVMDWAGLESAHSLGGPIDEAGEVVLGEAMKPFLEYGWQPQIMAVAGRQKAIFSGAIELFDVLADPGETRDLSATVNLPPAIHAALNDYPVPAPEAARAPKSDAARADEADAQRKLASLGYISGSTVPVVRKEAPRPRDMAHLFDVIEKASDLFVQERYAEVIPLIERILAQDSHNLAAALRLATAHSSLGHHQQAAEAFKKADGILPGSPDVRLYLALHYARGKEWERAVPLLERSVADTPERVPALEGLAVIRERQGRLPEAVGLRQKIYALRTASAAELVKLGELAMSAQQTAVAIESFEQARRLQATSFEHDLELGVLYLAARQYQPAKEALDRVPASHRAFPMALFKRAQVSVLLNEPDRAARIELARARADKTTRALIAKERLFQP